MKIGDTIGYPGMYIYALLIDSNNIKYFITEQYGNFHLWRVFKSGYEMVRKIKTESFNGGPTELEKLLKLKVDNYGN